MNRVNKLRNSTSVIPYNGGNINNNNIKISRSISDPINFKKILKRKENHYKPMYYDSEVFQKLEKPPKKVKRWINNYFNTGGDKERAMLQPYWPIGNY